MQSGIKRIYAPQKATTTIGGICRWWYVPVQGIASFPRIDAATQQYLTEPQLLPGYQWLGPIKVPDNKLGFTESQEGAKPGPWLKKQVMAYLPGDTPSNRILRQNMMHGEYVAVCKMRSGGMYLVVGNKESSLSYEHTYKSGNGGNRADAGADWILSGEAPYNAPLLDVFSADYQQTPVIPNRIFYGVVAANRLPTTAEIESSTSVVFTQGGDIKVDMRGDATPRIRFVAEYYAQPRKVYWYVNSLSFGPIVSLGTTGLHTWKEAGQVACSLNGFYRVYLTGFPTAFQNDIITLKTN